MTNSKVRCTTCKRYVRPEEIYRSSGLQRFCSEECLLQSLDTKRSTTIQRNTRDRARGGPVRIPKNKASFKGEVQVRRRRAPDEPTKAVREHVMNRDRGCRYCRTTRNLHIHHIVYRSQISVADGRHEPWNLIVLCNTHHDLVHSDKKRYMPLLRGLIWLAYAEGKYPTVSAFESQYGSKSNS